MAVEDRWFTKDGRKKARHGRGQRYQVRVADERGNWLRAEGFGRRVDADARDAELKRQVRGDIYVDPARGDVTFEAYADEWTKVARHDASTRALYARLLRLHINPEIGHYALRKFRHRHAMAATQTWERNLSGSLSRQVQAVTHTICNSAVHDRVIMQSPFHAIKLPPKNRTNRERHFPTSMAEVVAAIAELPDDLATIMVIASGSGMRISEILGLSPDDLTFLPKGKAWVRRQVIYLPGAGCYVDMPKTQESTREIPLPQFVMVAFAEHMRNHAPAEVELPMGAPDAPKSVSIPLVFHRDGRPLLRTTITNRIQARLRKADMSIETTPHKSRHLFESVLHDAGIAQVAIDVAMGHKPAGSMGVSQYAHVMDGAADRMRDVLQACWIEATDLHPTGTIYTRSTPGQRDHASDLQR